LSLASAQDRKTIMQHWDAKHRMYIHESLPSLRKVPRPQTTLCFTARLCLCKRPHLRAFVDSLLKALRHMAPADSGARAAAAKGTLVVRVASLPDAREAVWLHMSYTNMTTFLASIVPVVEDTDPWRCEQASFLGRVALTVGETEGATWWQALACIGDFQQHFEAALFVFCSGLDAVREFALANLLVEPLHGSSPVCFWTGPPPPQQARTRQRRRHVRNSWVDPDLAPLCAGESISGDAPANNVGGDAGDAQEEVQFFLEDQDEPADGGEEEKREREV
jgi:hypothetical protein